MTRRSPRFFLPCATLSTALVLLGLMVPQAGARYPHRAKPQLYKQTYDQIQAVDPAAKTVTIATMSREVADHPGSRSKYNRRTGQSRAKGQTRAAYREASVTLQVNAFTDIEVHGQTANFQALQRGMKVDVTRGMDENEAERLVVKN